MAAVRLASLGIRLGTPWQCGNRTEFPGGTGPDPVRCEPRREGQRWWPRAGVLL